MATDDVHNTNDGDFDERRDIVIFGVYYNYNCDSIINWLACLHIGGEKKEMKDKRICDHCERKCGEYIDRDASDKAYYDFEKKMKECDNEDEFHFRANRLTEPPVYIKGVDY